MFCGPGENRDNNGKLGDEQVNKKLVMMMAAAGLVTFAGTFAIAWFTRTVPAVQHEGPDESIVADSSANLTLPEPGKSASRAVGDVGLKMKRAITEKQLKNLIYDIQQKMQEYNNKLKNLEVREHRLQVAHNLIEDDIEELNNLRIKLATTVATLKSERDKLLKSRIEIAQAEKANLETTAATFDMMKPDKACKIVANLTKMQSAGGRANFDDAVKILHYMKERTKAKLLAELVNSEPELAAVLCQRLKQIIEKE
jgi:flagellar motility protein MotE (MotC chaperone)